MNNYQYKIFQTLNNNITRIRKDVSEAAILNDALNELTYAATNEIYKFILVNVSTYNDVLEMSYDPNDKIFNLTINSDELGPFATIEEFTQTYLEYFQNLSNVN